MAYKIHTVLFITDEDNDVVQDVVKISLQNSELFAPMLSFEGNADEVKKQMNESLNSLLLATENKL